MFKIRTTSGALPEDVLSKIADPAELAGALDVSKRDDTASLWITGPGGGLIAYAVFGRDDAGALTVYYAHAVSGMGAPLMKQFFGAAKVMGEPLRLHVDSVRQIKAYARSFGADRAIAADIEGGGLAGIFD